MKFIPRTLAAALLFAAGSAAQAAETPNASTQPENQKERVGIVPKGNHVVFIFLNPVDGKDAEVNKFYDQHMREFQNFPETVRMQQFQKLTRKDKADPEYKYVFIVEHDGDPDAYLAKVRAGLKDGSLGSAPAGIVAKLEGHDFVATSTGVRRPAADNTRVGITPADGRLLIVFAKTVEGKDPDYDKYYEEHMRQYMQLFPMFDRVQTFTLAPRKESKDPEFNRAVTYEYKGDQDVMTAAVMGALKDGSLARAPAGVITKMQANDYAAVGAGYRRVPKK